MPTVQTIKRQPPLRFAELSKPMQSWHLELQHAVPMNEVNTSTGGYTENPPPAGLNSTTGETNQNQEITYVKTSADGNTWTLAGIPSAPLPFGPYTLTTQGQVLKIKSNGTAWFKSA